MSVQSLPKYEQVMSHIYTDEDRNRSSICQWRSAVTIEPVESGSKDCINFVTTPKSGTHLMMKIFDLLGISYKSLSKNLGYAPHLCHYVDLLPTGYMDNEKVKSAFKDDEKYIITVRDPKDAIISYLQWIDEQVARGQIESTEIWEQTSFEEKLDQVMKGGKAMTLPQLKEVPWFLGNYLVAAKIASLGPRHILFLRFEDIIGPELGGNSKEVQVKELKRLCEFAGVRVTAQKIDQLIEAFPGRTLTYIDQKKTGKWKPYFTDEHKELYKKRFGMIAACFGYPKGFDEN